MRSLVGEKFGRLTVISQSGVDSLQKRRWFCQCECGGTANPTTGSLRSGNTKSCGCFFAEQRRKTKNRTHGMKKSPEWRAWNRIKQRCLNPTDKAFKDYGARGITVFTPWIKSFESFYAEVGQRPSASHSIDRINNDGNYEPGNCRWATHAEQQRNKRDNVRIHFNGETKTVVEWAEITGISADTIYQRVGRGLPVDKILDLADGRTIRFNRPSPSAKTRVAMSTGQRRRHARERLVVR